jgi:hypothetical protein
MKILRTKSHTFSDKIEITKILVDRVGMHWKI